MDRVKRLYRYEGLLKAVEFFTQRFNTEQITEFAFEFSNEILTLNASALFIKRDEGFVLKYNRLYPFNECKIPDSTELRHFPAHFGNIVVDNFEAFFSKQIIEQFNIKLVIPLMVDNYMVGFILTNGKVVDDFKKDDYIVADALMRLINNSLENCKYFAELKESNAKLDQKNFDLFAINQNTKVMLSEVTLEKLYTIATEVFSEVSGSRVTSFGIYDAVTEVIKIKGYRDVTNYQKYYTEIELVDTRYRGEPIVLHIERDANIIQKLFVNYDVFQQLSAKYIVLIVKEEILGLVTLGQPLNKDDYDPSLFELIESLAGSTYIAINNAMMFDELAIQKQKIDRKFKVLSSLNKLVRNINHCRTMEELTHLTAKTLQLYFGVKKMFFAFQQEGQYKITSSIGLEADEQLFLINDQWEDALSGETLYGFSEGAIKKYFNEEMQKLVNETNCVVISPILTSKGLDDSMVMEDNPLPFGFLIVLEAKDSLKEEEVLLIDTITKNISPIIYQIDQNSKIKQYYTLNEREKFLEDVENKLHALKEYQVPFFVYYKRTNSGPFNHEHQQQQALVGCQNYQFNGYEFMLSDHEINSKEWHSIANVEQKEDILNFNF
ncbi:GAF domain-containing protein [Amphibacillus cookii]|uniref:GAF domain-containing protein n=1 Tax=Amphibacillus cookii TaxID=767787 RepID=UPI00195A3277|nr:hypothetical protein [Amphibacillus cookii]MBM7541212.1 hypothetical protein [Amphibacillus cookii]